MKYCYKLFIIFFILTSKTYSFENCLAPESFYGKNNISETSDDDTMPIPVAKDIVLSLPDAEHFFEVGESDVKNVTKDEWLYADLKQCVAVTALNINTGERLLAHFSPWRHIGDSSKEKIDFIQKQLEPLNRTEWKICIVSTHRNFWDIPGDIKKVLENKGFSLDKIAHEKSEIFKKVYMDPKGTVHVIFDPISMADRKKPDLSFILSGMAKSYGVSVNMVKDISFSA